MIKLCENLMQFNINDCMQFAKPSDGSFNLEYVSHEITILHNLIAK